MIKRVLFLLLVIVFSGGGVFAYNGGSGAESNPYRISSKADLLQLGFDKTTDNEYFVMTTDIDLAGETFASCVIGGVYPYFQGQFDGAGYVVRNLKIDTGTGTDGESEKIGLFGRVDDAVIKNLGVEDLDISLGAAESESIGGICGSAFDFDGPSYFINCHASGIISVQSTNCSVYGVGGIVGREGNLNNCYSDVRISVGDDAYGVGGGCGVFSATITNCHATGSISAGNNCKYVGGLAGICDSISDSYSSGDVSVGGDTILDDGASGPVGGLAGSCDSISRCYATGSISAGSGTRSVGGLAGSCTSFMIDCYYERDLSTDGCSYVGGLSSSCGSMTNCYMTGSITAMNSVSQGAGVVGGLAASVGSMLNCSMTGNVSAGDNFRAGGLAGGASLIENCYVTGSVSAGSKGSAVGGVVGLLTEAAKNCYATGNVSVGDAGTAGGFACFSGGIIENCYATGIISAGNEASTAGGFAASASGGGITNCYATGAVSVGDDPFSAGGFAGILGQQTTDASLVNCYSIGAVTAGDNAEFIGGFCGVLSSASATGCYSSGNVLCGIDASEVGGFCGKIWESDSQVSECYTKGSVSVGAGSVMVGGFCGNNEGSVDDCYSSGVLSLGAGVGLGGGFCGWNAEDVTSSFWDTEVSGEGASRGGVGKTTAEMKTQSTFTAAGWDFSNVWKMKGYPVLRALEEAFLYGLIVNGGDGDGDYTEGVQVNITADSAPSGKVFDQWVGDVEYVDDVTTSSTFVSMPSQSVTVTATYKDLPRVNITVSGSGGSVSPSGEQIADSDGSLTLTATPNSGYKVKHWLVGGVETAKGQKALTLENITSDMTVEAVFEKMKAMPWLHLLLE